MLLFRLLWSTCSYPDVCVRQGAPPRTVNQSSKQKLTCIIFSDLCVVHVCLLEEGRRHGEYHAADEEGAETSIVSPSSASTIGAIATDVPSPLALASCEGCTCHGADAAALPASQPFGWSGWRFSRQRCELIRWAMAWIVLDVWVGWSR